MRYEKLSDFSSSEARSEKSSMASGLAPPQPASAMSASETIRVFIVVSISSTGSMGSRAIKQAACPVSRREKIGEFGEDGVQTKDSGRWGSRRLARGGVRLGHRRARWG